MFKDYHFIVETMDSIINTVSSYFKAVEYPQLSGQHVGTFCYDSIKDRHPVTITKVSEWVLSSFLLNNQKY